MTMGRSHFQTCVLASRATKNHTTQNSASQLEKRMSFLLISIRDVKPRKLVLATFECFYSCLKPRRRNSGGQISVRVFGIEVTELYVSGWKDGSVFHQLLQPKTR